MIVGIDPGFGRTGYGFVQEDEGGLKIFDVGRITTPAHGPPGRRLGELYDDLIELLENYRPDLLILEELYFTKNVSTGIQVGQARGVILLAADQLKIPVISFSPTQVKLAVTGSGTATKAQVTQMVKKLLKCPVRQSLKDDTADALALAICGSTVRIGR